MPAGPLVAKKPVDLDILGLAFRHPALAQHALLRETESLQQPRRCLIGCIDLGLDAAQAHGTESAAKQGRKCLVHESLAPVGSPQRVAELRSRASLVEPEEQTRADRSSTGFEHDDKLKGEPGCLDASHSLQPSGCVCR